MKIKLSQQDIVIEIELEDNPTSRELFDQLPLKVDIEDYASNEKIFYPPQKLSTAGALVGYEPCEGDITYYSPWGNVAIFYKDYSFSNGLIKMGRISSGLDHLKSLNDSEVLIEKTV